MPSRESPEPPFALRLAGPVLLAAGVALLVVGALRGEVRGGLLFIIPFVYGEGPLAALGALALMAGLLLTFAARFAGAARVGPSRGAAAIPAGERRVRHGGVLFIGPLPVVWGSDSRMAKWAAALGLLLLVLALWLLRR